MDEFGADLIVDYLKGFDVHLPRFQMVSIERNKQICSSGGMSIMDSVIQVYWQQHRFRIGEQ